MPKGIVLVIDDEEDLIELVRYNLERDLSIREGQLLMARWGEM